MGKYFTLLNINMGLHPVSFPLVIILAMITAAIGCQSASAPQEKGANMGEADSLPAPWRGAPPSQIPLYSAENGKDILYGYQLISKTSYYLGPNGTVGHISNGMNCQNCHLEAGTKPFGNNYGGVASTYPKFRERSGSLESIEKRVNDCIERSLNGQPLDSLSREMRAMVAYIKWLGKKVPKGEKPYGSGIVDLKNLDREADPLKGKIVFDGHCMRCHGAEGQGLKTVDGSGYEYPPLWGPHSYNVGAGLYRLSRFAGYVYNNMPNTVNHHSPELTQEQAWDVAAFVNSQPRPQKDLSADWPKMAAKPIDHPFGPYADSFSERQHKYGPYAPIAEWKKQHAKTK